jgi:hypothetical protein
VPAAPDFYAANENFFRELPEIEEFSRAVELARYADVPEAWWVVITDVRGSTRAIEAGRYRDVNALGVSSIVAVQNAVPDLELPYVFGGDGATLLVPGSRVERVAVALRGVQRLARDAFDLELRAATVAVREIGAAGERVRVARFRASPSVCLALLAGGGFGLAERWVKDPALGLRYAILPDGEASADLSGFECRWQPLQSRRGQVISLLVLSLAPEEPAREATYRRTLDVLDRLLGSRDARPVKLESLRMLGWFGDYSTEARVRSGARSGPDFERARDFARKKTLVGRALMATRTSAGGFDGSRYRAELVENTDFRKFDETLRMVLDVSDAEVDELVAHLERERAAERLVFGLHRSDSALMTCFARTYQGNHVHFVDGSNGGYALAAKQLKAQLAEALGRRSRELPHG